MTKLYLLIALTISLLAPCLAENTTCSQLTSATQRRNRHMSRVLRDIADAVSSPIGTPSESSCAVMAQRYLDILDMLWQISHTGQALNVNQSGPSSNSSSPPENTNDYSFENCAQLQVAGFTENGIYTIYPKTDTPLSVYCDLTTNGGGWTVFQKRFNGSVDFFRVYQSYEDGFGNASGEYWLGLQHMRSLVEQAGQELRVDIGDVNGNTAYAEYNAFDIGAADDGYRLSVGVYSGNAGDGMTYHLGQQFSAKDRDNDPFEGTHCAEKYRGAWWYKNCHRSNLNGEYYESGVSPNSKGLNWYHWKQSHTISMKRTEMKMRPANFVALSGPRITRNRIP